MGPPPPLSVSSVYDNPELAAIGQKKASFSARGITNEHREMSTGQAHSRAISKINLRSTPGQAVLVAQFFIINSTTGGAVSC